MKKTFFMSLILLILTSAIAHAQQEITMDSILGIAPQDTAQIEEKKDVVPAKRIRVNGFRVQVYYGGNDQKSKVQARNMAQRAKIWFEDLPVYTTFISPHWICRVGDFQTREEAMEVLAAMRESGRFPMPIIVKSKINIYEHELRREEPTDSCAAGDSTAYRTCFGIAGRGPAQGGLAKDSVACGSCHD
jgi:hypothetical protein